MDYFIIVLFNEMGRKLFSELFAERAEFSPGYGEEECDENSWDIRCWC